MQKCTPAGAQKCTPAGAPGVQKRAPALHTREKFHTAPSLPIAMSAWAPSLRFGARSRKLMCGNCTQLACKSTRQIKNPYIRQTRSDQLACISTHQISDPSHVVERAVKKIGVRSCTAAGVQTCTPSQLTCATMHVSQRVKTHVVCKSARLATLPLLRHPACPSTPIPQPHPATLSPCLLLSHVPRYLKIIQIA